MRASVWIFFSKKSEVIIYTWKEEKQKAKYAICTKPDGELEKNVWENSKICELFLK